MYDSNTCVTLKKMPGETVLKLKRKTPDVDLTKSQMVVVELQNEEGQKLGPPLNIPSNSSLDHLNRIVNQLLEAVIHLNSYCIGRTFSLRFLL